MKKIVTSILVLLMLVGIGVPFAIGAEDKQISTTSVSTVNGIEQKDGAYISKMIFNIPEDASLVDFFEGIYRLFLKLSLPQSLDTLYAGSVPETPGNPYLGEMFSMVGAFEGIAINLQEGDIANAKASYTRFSDEYKKTSNMVPEWKDYFDNDLVNKLGSDIDTNNVPEAFNDIGKIGESCERCHTDRKPQVWAKYYWRNFDTVNVNSPQGPVPWIDAMEMTAGGFDGIVINGAEGKWDKATDSYNLFKTMYMTNLKQACNNCHNTPRYYFVSSDVKALVDQMGIKVATKDLADIQAIQGQIGEQCMKCHIVHEPAQKMKDVMEK